MFVSKKIVESTDGSPSEKTSHSVVTKTVEKTGGVRTITRTVRNCPKDGIEEALKKMDIDPEKFHSGGTSVTKTLVYRDSAGKEEVIVETTETYGDPDKIAKENKQRKDIFKDFKETTKADAQKMGSSLGKDSSTKQKAKTDYKTSAPTASSGSTAKENKQRKDFFKDLKETTKTDAQKMGSSLGKDSFTTQKAKTDNKTSAPTANSGSMSVEEFRKSCLKAHNDYRAKHGVAALALNKEMCAYSQEWADHLAKTNTFEHRQKDKKYGENIYMKFSTDPNYMITGKEAVDSWYSEIEDHVFGKEPTSLKSGHFTQVIWKESKELGCAWAKSKIGKILVVANYNPAGNFMGKFAQNVPPLKK